MERRFRHISTGITVTNMVNPKVYCNTQSGMVLPLFMVERSTEFEEVYPIAYLGLRGNLLDLTALGAYPKTIHQEKAEEDSSHPIWDLEHLKNIKANIKRQKAQPTEIETPNVVADKYRLEGWEAARTGLRWIQINNDARWDKFADWRTEVEAAEKRLQDAPKTGMGESVMSCVDCDEPFKGVDQPCPRCRSARLQSEKQQQFNNEGSLPG